MRILNLDTGREMRGGQWQVFRLVEGLTEAGMPAVLLARAGSPLFRKARAAGLETHPLTLWSIARLSRRADLVHAHDARSHTLAALLSRSPLVVSRRVAFPVRSGWKYRRAAHYAAVSEFVKRILVSGGVPESKISVVPDGVPLLNRVQNGAKLVLPAQPDPLKGTDLALQAARLAGVPAHLSTDLETDLPSAALFVYITRSEGLGSAVLLAMSAGVPVIASKVGGLPEIVSHEESGLLTENTPEAIAESIRRLVGQPALAHRLAANARRVIEERFSINAMVRHTIDVYRQVLSC